MTIRSPLQLSKLNKANNTNTIVWTVLLVAALLFTQWAGLVHSVVHAGWSDSYVPASRLSDFYVDSIKNKQSSDGSTVSHSCTLFDAFTLAATVHTPPYLPLLLPTVRMVQLWVSYISRVVRFVPHFSSRAPPAP